MGDRDYGALVCCKGWPGAGLVGWGGAGTGQGRDGKWQGAERKVILNVKYLREIQFQDHNGKLPLGEEYKYVYFSP